MSSFLRFTSLAVLLAVVNGMAAPNPVIKTMANGMSLLKPVFVAEAKLQASVLGNTDLQTQVGAEIESEIKANKIVVYTYGLSPFSSEAMSMLEGYDATKIELGAEWFLLGGKESVKRVLLAEYTEDGATSLPKVFVNGLCIGGCAELADLVESGEFGSLVKPAGAAAKKTGLFGLF
jgi:glutaredoxin-related protein